MADRAVIGIVELNSCKIKRFMIKTSILNKFGFRLIHDVQPRLYFFDNMLMIVIFGFQMRTDIGILKTIHYDKRSRITFKH